MSEPQETIAPYQACVSTIHDKSTRASWVVSVKAGESEAMCSSCHFLSKRAGYILAEKRIPVSTMVVELPGNLSIRDLTIAIEKAKQSARVQGYWSDHELYSIVQFDNPSLVRLTFRKM